MERAEDGRAGSVATLLIEAAQARSRRLVDRVACIVEAAQADGCTPPLGVAATALRAMRLLEDLSGELPDGADLGPRLERMATVHLLASSSITLLATSISPLPLGPSAARCVVAVVRDLLDIVDAAADPEDGTEVSLQVGRQGRFVTALVTTSPETCAVLPAGGVQALARVARLAEACGGAARRWYGEGRLAICVVLAICDESG